MNKKPILISAIFLVVLVSLIYFKPGITGFAAASSVNNYTQEIGITATNDKTHYVLLENFGEVRSFMLSGSYVDGTQARVYLEYEDELYLILDTQIEGLGSITGYAVYDGTGGEVSNDSLDSEVSINLEYASGDYDLDNDGIAAIDEIVDLTVENTLFNWSVEPSKLCVKWKINSEDSVCYGSEDCCSFLGLESSKSSWDEIFYVNYGMEGVELTNTVSAQVIYANYSFDPPYSELYYSDWSSLNVSFVNATMGFTDACDETCLVSYNTSLFALVIEVDSGSITLDSVSYSVVESGGYGAMGDVTGTSANLSAWDEADSGYSWSGFVRYPKQNVWFFANYTSENTILNGTGIICNITFDDGVKGNMSFDGDAADMIHIFNRSYNHSGVYFYNVTCNGTGYDTLNVSENITITQPVAGFVDSGNSFTGGEDSSLVFADYNNDDNWDLIIAGESGTRATEFYKNLGNGNFALDSNYSVSGIDTGSLSFGDINNDGNLDLVLTGFDGTSILTRVYLNNGSSVINSQNLTGIRYSSVYLADIDNDGDIDLGAAGTTDGADTGRNTTIYSNDNANFSSAAVLDGLWYSSVSFVSFFSNKPDILVSGSNNNNGYTYIYNSSFANIQNLTGLLSSSHAIGDIDNDADLDLIISGSTTIDQSNVQTLVYQNNGTALNHMQTLNGTWRGSLALGDINNDGKLDLVMTGQNTTGASLTEFYTNNGTNFTFAGNKSISGIFQSSIALFDYDNDGDLDLGISGDNGAKVAYLYNNNVSLLTNNSVPSPPTELTTVFDGTFLNISWNNGTDDLTPALGLYYNIRVGTKPYANDIVSGKYGGSSNPTQGYLGNMQQRKNILINVSSNQTYFWQVQAIDTGLKAGSWSALQQYDPCAVPSDADWNITINCVKYNETITVAQDKDVNVNATLTLIDSVLQFDMTSNGNSKLNLLNGELNITNTTLNSTNSYGYVISVYNNTNITMISSYMSKAGYADNYGQRGLEINGTISSFDNNRLIDNYVGISFYSSNNELKNSNFSSSYLDIYSLNSNNNTLLNVTFANSNIDNGYLNVKWHLEVNVSSANESYAALNNVTVNVYNSTEDLAETKTTDSDGYAKFELLSYVNTNDAVSNRSQYRINFTKPLYDQQDVNINLSVNRYVSAALTDYYPTWSEFNNNLTTNFNLYNSSQLNNLSNVTIGINNLAQINFTQPVNVMGLNLDSLIEISYNTVSVSAVSGINKNALITLFNLSYVYEPVAMKDNSVCSDCSVISYSNNEFVFNVTGFSDYSSASNSKLAVSYSNRINQKPIFNQSIYFTANYTNRTSNVSINGTGVNCSIEFGAGFVNMAFNTTTLVYEYNRTFDAAGVYNYNVSCLNNISFENINLSGTATIMEDYIATSRNQSFEGIFMSSLALADIDGDGDLDLLSAGDNGSSVFLIYINNNSVFVLSSESIIGIDRGALRITDYNYDNKTDLMVAGKKWDGVSETNEFKSYKTQ